MNAPFARYVLAALVVACTLNLSPCWSQEAGRKDGLFISVPNPITSEEVQRIKQKVDNAIKQRRNITTVVFDFNPDGAKVGTTDFSPCQSLQRYIHQLQRGRVKAEWPRMSTVAFVHAETSKHTVLPVLACDQIIMSAELDSETRMPKARLGGVTRDLGGPIDDIERAVYRTVAKNYTSPDVILRMIDPDLTLRKARTKSGDRYVSPETLKELEEKGDLVSVAPGAQPGLQPGQSMFDPDLALEVKLCKAVYNSKGEVATALPRCSPPWRASRVIRRCFSRGRWSLRWDWCASSPRRGAKNGS
jgi:membrane-bound serine protease (ClpP class)